MTKETTKKIVVVLLILIILGFIFFLIDFNMVMSNKKPMCSILKDSYEDGGTLVYIGLGYKIFDYKILNGKNGVEFGTWFKQYNEN